VLVRAVIPDKTPELMIKPLMVLVEVGPENAPALVIEEEPVVAMVPVVEILIFEARSPPTIREFESTPRFEVWTIPAAAPDKPPRVIEPVEENEVKPESEPAIVVLPKEEAPVTTRLPPNEPVPDRVRVPVGEIVLELEKN